MSGTRSAAVSRVIASVLHKVATLQVLGIEIGEPCGDVAIGRAGRWLEIGAVIIRDDGLVEAVPCVDATAEQVFTVVRSAEMAKIDGPVGPWWTYIDGLGWETSVWEAIAASQTPAA